MLDCISRIIPFINHDDGTRAQMACSQMSQAVPLETPQVPYIRTGYEEEFLDQTTYLYKAVDDGTVLFRDKNYLIVKYDNKENYGEVIYLGGEIKNFDGFDKTLTSDLITNQNFKKDDIIARCHSVNKEGFLTLGRNLNTCYISHPYGYKDAIPISESCSKKMSIKYVYEQLLEFKDVIPIMWYKGDISYPQGTYVEKCQEIFYTKSRNPLNIQHISDIGTPIRAKASGELYYEIVVDEVVKTKNESKYFEDSYNQTVEYQNMLASYIDKAFEDDTLRADAYKRLYCPQTLIDRTGKSIFIKYWLVQHIPVLKGSKLSNRHGNKGVVSIVLPDNEMPISEDGTPADIIVTPMSVVSRMNPGQLYENHLNSAMRRVFKKANTMEDLNDRKDYIGKFLDIVQEPELCTLFRDNFNEDVWSKMVRDEGFQIIQRPFHCCGYDNLLKACKYSGMSDDLKENVTMNGEVHRAVFGPTYFMRLQHEPYKKYFASNVGTYNSLNQPSKSSDGSNTNNAHRLGELESWGLLGYNIPSLLFELYVTKSDNISEASRLLQALHSGQADMYMPVNRSVGAFNLLQTYLLAAGYDMKTDDIDLLMALDVKNQL